MLFRLKVFLSVAEHLNYTRASKELYISQPAISRHIQELEKEFQVRLLTRNGSHVSLTSEGEILRDKARVIVEDYSKLESEMRLLRGSLGGELKIGASTTIAQYLIAPILAGFVKRFPNVAPGLVTGNSEFVEDSVEKGRISIGLVEGIRRRPHLKYTFLAKDELVLVTSSATLCPSEINASDLPSIPLVLREPGSGTLEVMENALSGHSLKLSDLDVLLHIGATEGIKGYLKSSPGSFGVMSVISVRDALKADELKIVDISDMTMERDFSFVSLQGDFGPVQERF
ncbi:MAG: LysR substrate-binding domain-containing protein, partial [Candidatus Cryptobacteroides sp.]